MDEFIMEEWLLAFECPCIALGVAAGAAAKAATKIKAIRFTCDTP